MEYVQPCLSARKSKERSFHPCGRPVRLMQACLNVGKVRKSCFNRRAGAMKHVQACLSARESIESSFYHSGGPVKLV